MSESLNQLLADLHAERVANGVPEALKVNIDQRQHLVDTADMLASSGLVIVSSPLSCLM